MKPLRVLVAALTAGVLTSLAQAEIKVGVTLSVTGPAGSLGLREKMTIDSLPATIAGEPVRFIMLDDASQVPLAVEHTRKLLADGVDVVIGSSITPTSLAMVDLVAEAATPMISLAASARLIDLNDPKKRWVFKTPQNDISMALAIATHMAAQGIRTVGFIGFSDAYGESWFTEFDKIAPSKGLKVVANERYSRSDASVAAQTGRILAAKPDAVLVAASGTPGVLPQRTLKERGYAGTFYQTHGVANQEFIKAGGSDVEGTFLPVGPIVVATQLPLDHPVRKSALAYVSHYQSAYGKRDVISSFGAHAWDAWQLLKAAVPVALKKAPAGTPAFRAALRDALEQVRELPGAHGIFNLSPGDHLGLDQRSRVMVKIEKGAFKYIP